MAERQIAEFIRDDEVHAGQAIGKPVLPGVARWSRYLIERACFSLIFAASRSPNDATRFVLAFDRRGDDPIKLNRIMAWMFQWSMIFSENQVPLFGIML